MKSLKLILATAALSCVSSLAQLQAIQTPANAAETVAATINHAASEFFRDTPQAVGLSIGVVKDGEIYTFNYGTVEKGQARSPTANTLYPIASITKTFTGVLLAQAALEGKVKLDDDVRKYLNGDYPNLEFQGHPIRLLDLLDHRSGLPFFIPDRPDTLPGFENNKVPLSTRIAMIEKTYTRQDFYDDLHKVKLTAVPGEKFQYSNAAAMLAGYILEKLYGTTYEALLTEKVFGPLNMRATTITMNSMQASGAAKGYDEKGDLVPDNPNDLQAAGAIKSSVTDMLKYAKWNIEETNDAVKLSHEPVLTSGSYAAGLNWQIIRSGNTRLIWQEGNIDGFSSLCLVEPERKLGLVILANEKDDSSAHNLSVMTNRILEGLDGSAILLP